MLFFLKIILCVLLCLKTSKVLLAETADTVKNAFEQGIGEASYFATPRGHLIRYAHFKTPCAELGTQDNVVLLQGRGTFLEFYESLVAPLLERGLDVWTYDLSGQGASARFLSLEHHDEATVRYMQHIPTFDIYIQDAEIFIDEVVVPQAQGRLLLGGYSTGGHVALRYLQSHPQNPFVGAFVISPLLALKAPVSNTALTYLCWGASYVIRDEVYLPGGGHEDPIFTSSFEGNSYTSDKSSYLQLQGLCKDYRELVMGSISLGWLKAAAQSIVQLWQLKALQSIHQPLLIATGGADTVVDIAYNKAFASSIDKCQHVFYPNGRHELFREETTLRERWWADFDLFTKPLLQSL